MSGWNGVGNINLSNEITGLDWECNTYLDNGRANYGDDSKENNAMKRNFLGKMVPS